MSSIYIIRFILTKWFVNELTDDEKEYLNQCFILTKWFVN